MGIHRADEAMALIEALQEGDTSAFEELMGILKPVVDHVVWQFTYGSERYRDDFLQGARIAVHKAALRYDTVRHPKLIVSYFRHAISNQLIQMQRTTSHDIRLPRALQRFMHDVAREVVDWSASNEQIHNSYPSVDVSDIEQVRHQGGGAWTTMHVDNFCNFYDYVRCGQDPSEAFDRWATQRVDVGQIYCEIEAQVDPDALHVFQLRFLEDLSRPLVAQMMHIDVLRVRMLEEELLTTPFVFHYPSPDAAETCETLPALLTRIAS